MLQLSPGITAQLPSIRVKFEVRIRVTEVPGSRRLGSDTILTICTYVDRQTDRHGEEGVGRGPHREKVCTKPNAQT